MLAIIPSYYIPATVLSQLIGPITWIPIWPRDGIIYSRLFKYTQQTAGYTENNWVPPSPKTDPQYIQSFDTFHATIVVGPTSAWNVCLLVYVDVYFVAFSIEP